LVCFGKSLRMTNFRADNLLIIMENLDSFFKSAFTVDNVIFGFDEGDLKVLLIKRGEAPFDGYWGLPGYFVNENEDLEQAANRVLSELTGLDNVYLEQVKTFGHTNRHPFGRVITVAYYSLVKISDYKININIQSTVAKKAKWHSVSSIPELAFDHSEILEACFSQLKSRVRVRPIGFELLPPKFTLTQLQHLYEAILDLKNGLDKRNFRKKILSMNLLVDLNEMQEGVAHRPAKLYQFDKEKYEQFLLDGYHFEI